MNIKLAIIVLIIISFFSLLSITNASSGKLIEEINQLLSAHVNNPRAKYFNVAAGWLGEVDRSIQFRIIDSNSFQLFIPVKITIQKGIFLPSIKYSKTNATGLDIKNCLNFKISDQKRHTIGNFFHLNKIAIKTENFSGVEVNSGKEVAHLQVITSSDLFGHQEVAMIAAEYLNNVCGYDEMKDGLGGGVSISPNMPSSILENL